MYFNKKLISYFIIFETNIITEMVICVAVDSKSNSRQEIAFINFQGTKSCNSNGT